MCAISSVVQPKMPLSADAEVLCHDKEKHQRNAGDDLRVDDRHIADVVDDELALAGHRVDADGRQRAQHRGNDARKPAPAQGLSPSAERIISLWNRLLYQPSVKPVKFERDLLSLKLNAIMTAMGRYMKQNTRMT